MDLPVSPQTGPFFLFRHFLFPARYISLAALDIFIFSRFFTARKGYVSSNFFDCHFNFERTVANRRKRLVSSVAVATAPSRIYNSTVCLI